MITRQFVAISLAFCTLSSASGAQISDVIKVQQNLEHRIRDGGKQPTYENCVTESASLSTEEEVTKWYIDQFLNSKSVLHLLFAKPAGLDINAPIIDFCKHTFSCITRKNKEKQCDCEDLDAVQNLKDSFCQSFREIAQSPVGRMLLYRLLIEIYRNDNNQGTLGKDILEEISNHKLQVRNLSRNIKVVSDTAFAILEANQKKGYTQAFF